MKVEGVYCVAGTANGQSGQNAKRKGFRLYKFPNYPFVNFVQKYWPTSRAQLRSSHLSAGHKSKVIPSKLNVNNVTLNNFTECKTCILMSPTSSFVQ